MSPEFLLINLTHFLKKIFLKIDFSGIQFSVQFSVASVCYIAIIYYTSDVFQCSISLFTILCAMQVFVVCANTFEFFYFHKRTTAVR